jgi:hypothetical protein
MREYCPERAALTRDRCRGWVIWLEDSGGPPSYPRFSQLNSPALNVLRLSMQDFHGNRGELARVGFDPVEWPPGRRRGSPAQETWPASGHVGVAVIGLDVVMPRDLSGKQLPFGSSLSTFS